MSAEKTKTENKLQTITSAFSVPQHQRVARFSPRRCTHPSSHSSSGERRYKKKPPHYTETPGKSRIWLNQKEQGTPDKKKKKKWNPPAGLHCTTAPRLHLTGLRRRAALSCRKQGHPTAGDDATKTKRGTPRPTTPELGGGIPEGAAGGQPPTKTAAAVHWAEQHKQAYPAGATVSAP